MDTGIWAIWYDLDPKSVDDHHRWLHDSYLPNLIERPGYMWAAHYVNTHGGDVMSRAFSEGAVGLTDEKMGAAEQYLILVGAGSPHVFFHPSVRALDADADSETRDFLRQRKGVRDCVFIEERRVDGPAYGERAPATTTGPAIQMGTFRMRDPEDEFALAEWYAQFRLPAMSAMPGCIAARKLVSVAGWAKHSVLYEYSSLEARMEHFEIPHESLGLDPEHWSGKVICNTVHTPGSPVVGRRLWPAV
jgi:hypothetical protein